MSSALLTENTTRDSRYMNKTKIIDKNIISMMVAPCVTVVVMVDLAKY